MEEYRKNGKGEILNYQQLRELAIINDIDIDLLNTVWNKMIPLYVFEKDTTQINEFLMDHLIERIKLVKESQRSFLNQDEEPYFSFEFLVKEILVLTNEQKNFLIEYLLKRN